MPNSVMITAKQFKRSGLQELLRNSSGIKPSRILLYFQEPKELSIIDDFLVEHKSLTIVSPMLKLLGTEPQLLASMCSQVGVAMNSVQLFLFSSNEAKPDVFDEYMTSFVKELQEKDVPAQIDVIYLCASASDFFTPQSNVNEAMKHLVENKIPTKPCIILANTPEHALLLENKDFSTLLEKNTEAVFALIKTNSEHFDLTPFTKKGNEIIFWSTEYFLEFFSSASAPKDPSHKTLHPKTDRVSVWDDQSLTGTVLQKVNKGDSIFLVETILVRGKRVGKVENHGFVDLSKFNIEYGVK